MSPRGSGGHHTAPQIEASRCYTHDKGEVKRQATGREPSGRSPGKKGCSLPPGPALLLRPRTAWAHPPVLAAQGRRSTAGPRRLLLCISNACTRGPAGVAT